MVQGDDGPGQQPPDAPGAVATRYPDGFRHGDGRIQDQDGHGKPRQRGCDGSVRAGTSLTLTVFVSPLDDGTLFLQGWPMGMNLYLSAGEAQPLMQELASVFRREERLCRSRNA